MPMHRKLLSRCTKGASGRPQALQRAVQKRPRLNLIRGSIRGSLANLSDPKTYAKMLNN